MSRRVENFVIAETDLFVAAIRAGLDAPTVCKAVKRSLKCEDILKNIKKLQGQDLPTEEEIKVRFKFLTRNTC